MAAPGFSILNMVEFQNTLQTSGLFDLPIKGAWFTWSNLQPANPILKKLDRAIVNDSWLQKFPDSFAVFDPPQDSDHCPCLVSLNSETSRKNKTFKYFNFFSSHPSYLEDLSEVWANATPRGSSMFCLAKKLKLAKIFCKGLNKSEFSDIRNRAKEALDSLVTVQNELLTNPSPELFQRELLAREKWNFFAMAEESFLKQKSRVKWLNEGDSNSSFFHRVVRSNQSKNAIVYLRDSLGGRVTDMNLIKLMAVNHFKALLGTPNIHVSPLSVLAVKNLLSFRCNDSLSTLLSRIPTSEEVLKVVSEMPKNKAPGPDGFSVEFYTQAWSIVGEDTVKAVLEFFYSGSLLKQFNATSICLIPKVPGADTLSDFRPVSCCNTIYKIISRILAQKLQTFLPQAVQLNQVGFIKGRHLCENVLLASEMVTNFHKSGPIKRGCLKVDISKAYDSVNWEFIINILHAYDIPPRFVNWIEECISTTSFSVALNGELAGYFPGKKGLRQGDPISSYLFVIAMDVLSKKLDALMTNPRFKPHPLGRDPLITNLSFADDLLVFFDGSEDSLSVIMNVFDEFALVSGLRINHSKTTLILDGNQVHVTRELAAKFNLQQGCLPLKYLGVPLTSQKLKPMDFQPLIDRVVNRVNSWTVSTLSFAGRLQLIRSVIGSMVNFWSSMFMLPKDCLSKIEKVCNAYLWTGSSASAKGAKIAWESVCQPKNCGGLGLRRLQKWNVVFGLKLIWLLFSGSGSLWVSWIHKHFILNKSFWLLNSDRKGSWIWRKLCKLRPIARPFLSCVVGNGETASFWHDWWSETGPLFDIFGAEGPRLTGIILHTVVAGATRGVDWALPRGRNATILCLRAALPSAPMLTPRPDSYSWVLPSVLSSSGAAARRSHIFSTAKTWAELNPPINVVPWHKAIWFTGGIPKHSFMSWVAAWKRLPTRTILHAWGLNTPLSCPLCSLEDESISHLFFRCSFSHEVWTHFMTRARLSPPQVFDDILIWIASTQVPKKLRLLVKLIFQAALYDVWKERNARVHNAHSRPYTRVIKDISQTLSNRISYLSRSKIQSAQPSHSAQATSSISGDSLRTWIQLFLASPST